MNKNREISAESQHNFHFLAHFNSKTTELIFTIFLYDIQGAPIKKQSPRKNVVIRPR